jgi:hypothetical protein
MQTTALILAEVGAVYNLSKRSSLKAVYAYLDNEANATFDFGVNASGVRHRCNHARSATWPASQLLIWPSQLETKRALRCPFFIACSIVKSLVPNTNFYALPVFLT